ncbi:Putative oxidoreductase [Stieleria maiorica]|uniref:Oxidoreductase n=1 Tax=Stieleria maiorica TaxID=2795974 RepID=A0A5B9MNX8_9BACT|nr:NAD(P)/FAD-dependent oxidoreductase [Stieleria maiorica]QEG01385.1 Putative oxidoreductase [Stieleria maiorica]
MGQELTSTISRQTASGERWDAVIVGAGIAGSLTALGLARRGRKVLLIERSTFPRHKVCGACLNSDAIAGLRGAGVWNAIEAIGGHGLDQYCLRSGRSRANLELPGGHAVSRYAMDRVLVESAIAAGAQFLSETAVTIIAADADGAQRSLCDNDGNRYDARIVVAANGLASKPVSGDSDDRLVVPADSRIGLGAHWNQGDDRSGVMHLASGVIYMAIADTGYVGLVMTENQQVNLAAAVDRAAVQTFGPSEVCHQILRSCGWDLAARLESTDFRGTPTLTRRRKIAGAQRLFFVGDSSGYVEPFTGEGMAWAVRAGTAVVPRIDRAIRHWDNDAPQQWTDALKKLLGRQQRRCRWISRLLRHPRLVHHTIGAMSRFPRFGQFAVQQVQREHARPLEDDSLEADRLHEDRLHEDRSAPPQPGTGDDAA